jgi:hypothetical protein
MKVHNPPRITLMMSAMLVQGVLILTFAAAAAQAQSLARANRSVSPDKLNSEARAIAALKTLEAKVVVYQSLGQFEVGGRLARVTLREFETELTQVSNEIVPLLAQVPAGKVRTEIVNAFASYRDGVFWWRQIDQPKVVHVSALTSEGTHSLADSTYSSTIPYTVAIHWRQAQKYLNQAERNLGR